jgi:hypothetical protein
MYKKCSKTAGSLIGQDYSEVNPDELYELLIGSSHICITIDKNFTIMDAVIYYNSKPLRTMKPKIKSMAEYYQNPIMGREFWDVSFNELSKLLIGTNHTHITINKGLYVVSLTIHYN